MTLEDVLNECVEHQRNNPDHGINCVCMDQLIREVRKGTKVGIINSPEQNRVDYVFSEATKWDRR